jgi:hypothetical protein
VRSRGFAIGRRFRGIFAEVVLEHGCQLAGLVVIGAGACGSKDVRLLVRARFITVGCSR